MTDQHKKLPLRAAILVAVDILCVGMVLVVFALFHHVLPKKGTALEKVVTFDQPSASAQLTTVKTQQTVQSTDAPAPATPRPAEPGDFSASFPLKDTGDGAMYSYQGDALRVAINQVQEDDVTYYVADVWVKNIQTFRTAFAKDQYGTGIHEKPVKIAAAKQAIFAMTGDYYGARSKGVVIRNGDLYRDSLYGDVCVLHADGTLETYRKEEFDALALKDAWQAWSFGPLLLDNGQAIEEFSSSIKGKNPRNAIGYYEPGHYCFITVDGRQPGYSDGMTLAELAKVFESLGCKTAYNLDGGATAEMIFQGERVNKPSKGGRESSDIICF